MKNKNLFIISFSLCLIALTSCKKEGSTNIIHKNINQQIVVNSELLDTAIILNFNDDLLDDFFARIRYLGLIRESSFSLFLASDDSRNQVLSFEDAEYIIAKKILNNTSIDSNSTIWHSNGYLYYQHRLGGSIIENYVDVVGAGDVFIGIRFIIDGQYHYGWLKVAVSTDFKTINIKEVAYNKIPNVAIKAGEK
ncbi:MAG: hypothetical protein R2807_02685 [Chitinophagales bacterium]